MSNPVPPPGGAYPPAGDPAYAASGAPQPGAPQAGAYGVGPAGQPGYPAAGDPAQAPVTFPADEKKKGGGAGKLVLRIVVAIVVAIAVFGLKTVLFGGDDAKDAKAGDCIASDKAVSNEGTTETGANVVDCTSSDAKFTVVARVDGETSTQSKACDKFFKESEEFYVFANANGDGYILCLKPKA